MAAAVILRLVCKDPSVRIDVGPNKVLRIGRVAPNDVVVPHYSMGRSQAVVRGAASGATIEDAGSPTGTFVNGLSIHEATPIKPGDVLRLGGLTFAVEEAR